MALRPRRPDAPRAAPPTLSGALDDLPAGGLARGRREVLELLRAAARCLEESPEPAERIARRFGVGMGVGPCANLDENLKGLEHTPSAPERGAALVLADWRELFAGTFRRVAVELLRGHRVRLVPDARWAEPAEFVAAALQRAGFEGSELEAVLPAPPDALHRVLANEGLRAVSASGSVESIRRLRHRLAECGPREVRLRALRSGAWEVRPDLEVDRAARDLYERAFGSRTLGGQLPGQVSRAWIPARRYSALTRALLEVVERRTEQPAPRLVDAAAGERVRAALQLGLDEGATLLSGDGGPGGGLEVRPAVFCNVEPHTRTARRVEPLPVLALVRA